MTKFADELFTDLMHEHGSTLDAVRPPARRTVPRPLWLAAGVVGMAGAITAGVTVFNGDTPAYAVTDNGDGTVTISISQLSGVDGANNALRSRGDRVVIVPVRDGCPAFNSIPEVPAPDGSRIEMNGRSDTQGGTGTLTVNVHGVPAGDTVLVPVRVEPNTTEMFMKLIRGHAPSCIGAPPVILLPPDSVSVTTSVVGSPRGPVTGSDSGTNQVTGH